VYIIGLSIYNWGTLFNPKIEFPDPPPASSDGTPGQFHTISLLPNTPRELKVGTGST